jgi:type I restriction enzyme S subunit
MELKPGYKQTEVGVLPEDWDLKLLPDVLRCRSGKAHEQFISDTGSYVCVNSKFISTDGRVRKYSSANFCPTRNGDVLMVMSDLPNGRALAKAYFVEADNIYAVNQRVCALTAYRDNPKYLFYILNRNPYFLSFDDGVSQTHLLNRVFQKCPIPLPQSTKEQSSIAEALSDVDSLLYDLDQLVTKKRAIKQAAMQELLTGKRRLPRFEGEWEVKRLGEVMRFQVGFPFSSTFFNDKEQGVRLVKNRDLKSDDQVFHYLGQYDPSFHVCDGDVLVGMDGDFLPCRWSKGAALLNQRVGRIVPLPGLNLSFAFYYLISPLKEIEMATASTTVKHLSHSDIESIEKPLPSVPEQTAIATILSEMDAELAALETRRDKTRELKQGMMQELLTGRIRLQ